MKTWGPCFYLSQSPPPDLFPEDFPNGKSEMRNTGASHHTPTKSGFLAPVTEITFGGRNPIKYNWKEICLVPVFRSVNGDCCRRWGHPHRTLQRMLVIGAFQEPMQLHRLAVIWAEASHLESGVTHPPFIFSC